MATMTFTVVAGATFTKTFTVTAAQAARLLAEYGKLYGQVPSGPPDPQTGIVPMRDRTTAEIADALFVGLMNGILANVRNSEQATASKTAVDAVAPITPT